MTQHYTMQIHAVYQIKQVGNPQRLCERYHVKVFKHECDMHEFRGRNDNSWIVDRFNRFPKSGVYAFAGGQYRNVKTLDATALAHI